MSISGGVIEAFESQLGRVMRVTTAFEGRAKGMSLIRLAAIHCRMLAHAEALLPLARVGCVPAIPTLLRSELDGYIDFHLLYEDDDYCPLCQRSCEPPRDCRRLHSLRGWGHVTKNQVFPRSPRTSGSDGHRID